MKKVNILLIWLLTVRVYNKLQVPKSKADPEINKKTDRLESYRCIKYQAENAIK